MALGARPLPRKYVAKLNETNSAVAFAGAALAAERRRAYGHDETLRVLPLGAWSFDPRAKPAFRQRLREYFTKALREAKVKHGLAEPGRGVRGFRVRRFVDTILDRASPFMRAFLPFQARVAELGIYNSLVQVLIKIAAPGIPDFYKGRSCGICLWSIPITVGLSRSSSAHLHRPQARSSAAHPEPPWNT